MSNLQTWLTFYDTSDIIQLRLLRINKIWSEYMNIYIDFDDTITMSVENVVRIINHRFDKNIQPTDIAQWDFSDVYPDIPLQDIVKVFGEKEFFETLKLKPYVITTLRKYIRYNNITIVSKVDAVALKRKNDWIKKHIIDLGIPVKFRGIPLDKSKGIIDMSNGIMVDDNAKFLNETNAKYKILYKCNRKFDDLQEWHGLTVSNWKELDNLFNTIITNEKGYTNGKI